MHNCVKPICCPPVYCVQDHYAQRMVPVIHPIVTINRQNIIDVPQHYYQETTQNVVINQGFQVQALPAYPANQGIANRSHFFLNRR